MKRPTYPARNYHGQRPLFFYLAQRRRPTLLQIIARLFL